MTSFDEWFTEFTGFLMRYEWFDDLLKSSDIQELQKTHYINWLRSAYIAGQESVKEKA